MYSLYLFIQISAFSWNILRTFYEVLIGNSYLCNIYLIFSGPGPARFPDLSFTDTYSTYKKVLAIPSRVSSKSAYPSDRRIDITPGRKASSESVDKLNGSIIFPSPEDEQISQGSFSSPRWTTADACETEILAAYQEYKFDAGKADIKMQIRFSGESSFGRIVTTGRNWIRRPFISGESNGKTRTASMIYDGGWLACNYTTWELHFISFIATGNCRSLCFFLFTGVSRRFIVFARNKARPCVAPGLSRIYRRTGKKIESRTFFPFSFDWFLSRSLVQDRAIPERSAFLAQFESRLSQVSPLNRFLLIQIYTKYTDSATFRGEI